MGPLVRCYVGIRVPAEFWPKLQEAQMAIRRKSASDVSRWVGQSEILLPLCALGEQPWDMVKRATGVISPICAKYPALNLALEGLVGLPNNNQPRFVSVNVTGDTDALCRLREELARAFGPLIPASEKAFVPMVNLGRLKVESEQARTALGRAVRMTPPEVLGQWQANEVELLRTDATAMGVQYQTIEKYPLNG